MGRALAGRLVGQGHDVTVWNRSPGRAGELAARGATEAPDPVSAVAGAEVVMSILAADDAVTEVLAPGGVVLPLEDGAVLVECSTVSPATTRHLAVAYDDRLVASPVLGSPSALEAGEAGLVVAGPTALLDRLEPVWSSLSSAVRRVGEDPGSALVVKLLNNYLLMGGIAVLAEAITFGQRCGLDDALLAEMLPASPMVAAGLRNRVADLIAGDHEGWFPTPMGAKDLQLLLAQTEVETLRLPVAGLIADRYDEAAHVGFADRDITAIIELSRGAGRPR